MIEIVPQIGHEYHFFDDGKVTLSRHSIAKVVDIITPEQAKHIPIEYIHNEYLEKPITNLYDVWKAEIDSHRQTTSFRVINGSDTKPGSPWLYSEETDFFVKCTIPDYDDNDVWFVRTVRGKWFSLNTVGTWMGGLLDVTGVEYDWLVKYYKEEFGEDIEAEQPT